jgi:hypothetical protein
MTTATTGPCGPIEISFTQLNSNFRKHAYRNIKEIKEKKHRMLFGSRQGHGVFCVVSSGEGGPRVLTEVRVTTSGISLILAEGEGDKPRLS